jgi:predicted RNase H-like HicB family nuclease
MSTRSDEDELTMPTQISLELSDDGEIWIACDEETNVAAEGETRQEALAMLDDAVAAYRGEAGREPTNEELRDIGIEPESNRSEDLADILK